MNNWQINRTFRFQELWTGCRHKKHGKHIEDCQFDLIRTAKWKFRICLGPTLGNAQSRWRWRFEFSRCWQENISTTVFLLRVFNTLAAYDLLIIPLLIFINILFLRVNIFYWVLHFLIWRRKSYVGSDNFVYWRQGKLDRSIITFWLGKGNKLMRPVWKRTKVFYSVFEYTDLLFVSLSYISLRLNSLSTFFLSKSV